MVGVTGTHAPTVVTLGGDATIAANGDLTVGALAITDGKLAGSISDGKLATPYVKADGTRAFTGAQSMGGFKITSLGAPAASTDAATMGYVDSVAQGLDIKPSVRLLATADLSLTGAASIDSISVATGNRVLAIAQANPIQNGIYVVNTAGAWTRAADMAAGSDAAGAFTFIEEGSVDHKNSGWVCNEPMSAAIVGTSPLSFTKFSQAGSGVGGSGTAGTLVKFSASTTLADSIVSESGTILSVTGDVNLNGAYVFKISGTQITSAALSNDAALVKGGGAATSGYVGFWSGASTMSYDSGMFWDNTNKWFGVGTTTPGAAIDVVASATASGPRRIRITNYSSTSAGDSPSFFSMRARGTSGSPVAVLSGDRLMQMDISGYGDTGFGASPSARMQVNASENHSDTAHGTEFQWNITPNTTAAMSGAMWLRHSGSLNIGQYDPYLSKKLFVGCANGDGIRVSSGGIFLDMTVDAFGVKIAAQTNHNLRLATNDLDRVTVGFGGTVGIGVAPATAMLSVGGDVNITTGSIFRINGVQIALSDLSDGANAVVTNASKAILTGNTLTINSGAFLNVIDGLRINSVTVTATSAELNAVGIIVTREQVAGTKNGTNPTFTLANTPIAGSEMLYRDGILMEAGAGNDYTISGPTITMLGVAIPQSTTKLVASYRYHA